MKCSLFNCKKDLSIENREVFAVIVRGDGHRIVCKEHYDAVKFKNLKITLEDIYGVKIKRYDRHNKFKFRQKEQHKEDKTGNINKSDSTNKSV